MNASFIHNLMSGLGLAPLAATVMLSATSCAHSSESVRLAGRTTGIDPVIAPHGSINQVLSQKDQDLYQKIFTLQGKGKWQDADELISMLADPLLLGHVRHQRHMHPYAYRSSYDELKTWLDLYGDHPGAERAFRLAVKRQPKGALPPQRPESGFLRGSGQQAQEMVGAGYRSKLHRTSHATIEVQRWLKELDRLATNSQADRAMALFEHRTTIASIDKVEVDLGRWAVARALLGKGRYQGALRFSRTAVERLGKVVPEMHWTVGIAAWHQDDIDLAARHFAILATTEKAARAERIRAAYWAARSVGYGTSRGKRFLQIAATSPRHFYGLLARVRLGAPLDHQPARQYLKAGMGDLLLRHPAAKRAIALAQIGQHRLAEQEIRRLAIRTGPEVTTAMMAIARSLHLPAIEMRLAHRVGYREDLHLESLYPLPIWQPKVGYLLDQALVFAVMRAESGFDPNAKSHVGALGLMQVMPQTAVHIAKRNRFELGSSMRLLEPEIAITFGQAYIQELLERPAIHDNLIYIAAGYNAGPGRIERWRDRLSQRDPLLFIESIPFTETRIYVKKVLSNLWNYRVRLNQAHPSLEAIIQHRWPRYETLENRQVLQASSR